MQGNQQESHQLCVMLGERESVAEFFFLHAKIGYIGFRKWPLFFFKQPHQKQPPWNKFIGTSIRKLTNFPELNFPNFPSQSNTWIRIPFKGEAARFLEIGVTRCRVFC